jgi:uncharacterized protein (DUF2235 family)
VNISIEELAKLDEEKKAHLSEDLKALLNVNQPVPIKFVGLFDTVRAAGLEVFDLVGSLSPS